MLYGSMVGDVKDASGAGVPGAEVVVTQQQTQLVRKTVADQNGRYSFATLTPGDYDVKISAPGFKTFSKQQVPVTLNSIARVDASLEVGAVNETVEVNAAAPPLQTDRADVSHEVDAATLENAPIPPGRNYQQLLRTVPGITG